MPIQYIVGDWDFCDVTLTMRPPVFLPRPETEQLAQLAAERLHGCPRARLLEVGCGSGALSVYILRRLRHVSALAVDQSSAACSLTAENGARSGVHDRLQVRQMVLTAAGLPAVGGPYDLVVSNPPYVPSGHVARLQPEIRLYEDHAALDGGPDGLRVIRHLLDHAAGWLRPGGALLLEVHHSHPAAIERLLATPRRRLGHLRVRRDFAGKHRFIEAQRIDTDEANSL